MAKIQIEEELFYTLVRYFLAEDNTVYEQCRDGIEERFTRAVNRDLYSKMHDASLSAEDKEKARQEYLDRRGIPNDFRWGEEWQNGLHRRGTGPDNK